MKKPIQVTRSSMPSFEDYMEEIRDLWESHWLTNNGSKHLQLEKEVLGVLGVNYLNLFTNGHLALEAMIQAFNLSGEVITTPFTFISTTHAIVRSGLTPVFCDINPVDYTIDVEKIERLITEKTTAIIPVHVYGNVCNVKEIERLAKKYNLKVLYDAAHAFGVSINGVGIGNFGDASMFSFHATKVFNTIEGGAVTSNDPGISHRLNLLKNFGISGPETAELIGGNGKMSEFQAAMGLCNLKHLQCDMAKREVIVHRYQKHLNDVPGIKLNGAQVGVQTNHAYFPVLFVGYKKSRDEVFEQLKKEGFLARKYFYPLISDLACYKDTYDSRLTPVAKEIAEQVLTLPLYPDLELEVVDAICRIIKD